MYPPRDARPPAIDDVGRVFASTRAFAQSTASLRRRARDHGCVLVAIAIAFFSHRPDRRRSRASRDARSIARGRWRSRDRSIDRALARSSGDWEWKDARAIDRRRGVRREMRKTCDGMHEGECECDGVAVAFASKASDGGDGLEWTNPRARARDVVGISRDSLHKRRATGGKQKPWRKKRKCVEEWCARARGKRLKANARESKRARGWWWFRAWSARDARGRGEGETREMRTGGRCDTDGVRFSYFV